MSLDTLLSEMNESEIELLAAELVARLSGQYSAPRSVSDAPDSALSPSQYSQPEIESKSSELINLPSDEPPAEFNSESRDPSPALEQILTAMKSWDTELSPDSVLTSDKPVFNANFPDRTGVQDGSFDEPRERHKNFDSISPELKAEYSNTSFPEFKTEYSNTGGPTEISLGKVPYNINFTEAEESRDTENSDTAFSCRGDTVPAFRSGMEKVSDFFMRDSRRYDSGFERF